MPRLSRAIWSGLFVLITSGGAALALYTLPANTSDTAWFWFCVALFPVLAWTFLLFAWLSFLHAKRATALATNQVSDRELDRCHERASEPLALIAHAWIFSGEDKENEAVGITDDLVQLKPRPSRAIPNIDVSARWIDIPGRSINAGNAFGERNRHRVISEWLLLRLVAQLALQLRKLPSSVSLHVTLSIGGYVDATFAGNCLEDMLADLHLNTPFTVVTTNEKVSLFRVDEWLDESSESTLELVVAVQLRDAISTVLKKGDAEAAVALLMGHPSLAAVFADHAPVNIHRPAKGQPDKLDDILLRVMRWGRSAVADLDTVWTCDMTPSSYSVIRTSNHFVPDTALCDLNATIGNCGFASSWLTLALAARQTIGNGRPQIVIIQEGEEIIALACKTETSMNTAVVTRSS